MSMQLCRRCLTIAVVGLLVVDAMAQSNHEGGVIASPRFSPSDSRIVAFERQREQTRVVGIHNTDLRTTQILELGSAWRSSAACGGLFADEGCSADGPGYQGELAWKPTIGRDGVQWLVYVSGERGGGFEMMLTRMFGDEVAPSVPVPLNLIQVREPTWSADGNTLVFRGQLEQGGEDLFAIYDVRRLLDLHGNTSPVPAQVPVERLTWTPNEPELSPVFSPVGRSLAFQHRTGGQFAISVIDVPESASDGASPPVIIAEIELDGFDRYKPSWSPDGRFLAFYTSSETIAAQNDRTLQDIAVAQVLYLSGTRRVSRGQLILGASGDRIARAVLPNERLGPQWLQVGERMGVLYVLKDESRDYPAYLRWVSDWMDTSNQDYEENLSRQFGTVNNQELTASWCGSLQFAFAAQVGSRMRLENRDGPQGAVIPACMRGASPVRERYSAAAAMTRSMILPGQGQAFKGQSTRAWLYRTSFAVGAIGAAVSLSQSSSLADDYDATIQDAVLACPAGECREGGTLEARHKDLLSTYNDYSNKRTMGQQLAVFAAAVWIASVVDAGIGSGRSSPSSLRLTPVIAPSGAGSARAGLRLNYTIGHRNVPTNRN